MSESARRLAVVINSLGTGGAETQLVSILPEVRRRGWEVRVFSFMAGPVGQDLEAAGIPVHSLGLRRRDPRWVGAPFRLARELAQFRPGVVHAHLTQATLISRLAGALGRRVPLVDSVHYTDGEARWRSWVYRVTGGLSDRTSVLNTRAREEQLRRRAVDPEKIVVVANGIDADRFRPDEGLRHRVRRDLDLDGRFVWITVGRLVEEKDQATLLAGFKHLRRLLPDSTLMIVGDGPLADSLRQTANRLELGNSVVFRGEVREVRPLYAAADAFVLSSRREGLPMVLLEAMSMELPIVSTAVGSIPDIAKGEGAIHLVAPGDPKSLAGAMATMTALSTQERQAMGRAARATILDHFGASAVAAEWTKLYTRLLQTSSPPSGAD